MSISVFLITGFELEDSQYVTRPYWLPISGLTLAFRYLIRHEASQMKGVKTSKQLADLQEKRNALLSRIQNWREVQFVYTPHVVSLISQALNPAPHSPAASFSHPSETFPEDIPLFLPSSLPPHIRALPELQDICQLERRLREPQADDALGEIRRQRRVIQGLWLFKRMNMSGMGNKPNTRMTTLYKRFDNKTNRAAEKYQSARRALSVLDPDGSWSMRLKELKKEDISGPGKDSNDTSTTNSRYQMSWIWLVPLVGTRNNDETTIGEEEFNGTMQVEWSKARARMKRWNEELLIVQEEMRRAIVYLVWKAGWWRERSSLRDHMDETILSGVSGYAHKQAMICSRMAERCAVYWLPHLREKGVKPTWEADYEHLLQASLDVEGDQEEGDDEINYEGNEEELDADNVIDDYNDFEIDD
jgi:hypothetical protein